jgi:hypothetical protein
MIRKLLQGNLLVVSIIFMTATTALADDTEQLNRDGQTSTEPAASRSGCKNNSGNPEQTLYMFSYFNGNGEDGLHLAFSKDCYKWEALNQDRPFLKPELSKDKLMRDPCIIKGNDGLFHMVWTVSWSENGIGYASSEDLIHWSKQKYIPVMAHEDSVRNCWAPEITCDEANGEYMIYWSSTIRGRYPDEAHQYGHRIYYVTTKDFNTFSETKLLFDPGYTVIDANIARAGNRWVMFYKDERERPLKKNLNIAYADRLKGPYTAESQPITQTDNYLAEGPTVVKANDGWIVYFDKFNEGKYGAIISKDLKTWEDVSDRISLPKGIRHGTIFKVTESFFESIFKNKMKVFFDNENDITK